MNLENSDNDNFNERTIVHRYIIKDELTDGMDLKTVTDKLYRAKSFVITKPNEILIGAKKLEPYRIVAERLIDRANISDNPSKKVIDFNRNVSYDGYTQDILLHHLLGKKNKLTEQQINAIQKYKSSSAFYNLILRGEPEMISQYYSYYGSIESACKTLICLNGIFNGGFPALKHDLVLYRGGSVINQRTQIGTKNEYLNLVSFSTNADIATRFAKLRQNNSDCILYMHTLASGDNIIFPDTISQIGVGNNKSESEVLLPPFSYQVEDIEQMQINNSLRTIIKIGNVTYMDIPSVLSSSLSKLKMWIQGRENEIQKAENSLAMIGTEEDRKKLEFLGYDESDISEEQIDLRDLIAFLKEKKIFNLYYKRKDSEILSDNLQYKSREHGVNHTRRVFFMANALAVLGNLNHDDTEVLLAAVQYHDIGREHDYEDTAHGKKSVDKILQSQRLNKFKPSEQDLILFLIEHHSKSKEENELAIMKLPQEQQERYRRMLDYIKDADKLDRIILGKYDGLDPSRLSLPISKKLIKAAYQSYLYLFDFLQLEDKENIQNMNSDVDAGIKFVEKSKGQDIEKIETEDIVYPDDGEISANILKRAINEGKSYISLSKLNQLGMYLKDKLAKFFGKFINFRSGDDYGTR